MEFRVNRNRVNGGDSVPKFWYFWFGSVGSRNNEPKLSDETRGPRANLSPLFTKKLLKVATRRHFLSCLGIFWPNFWNFLINNSIFKISNIL